MNIETFRNYCFSFIEVTESFPFDKETLVFKVHGKIFVLCHVENFESVNLKCDPERAIELREQFDGINPGYHMNKKHWNTVSLFMDVSDEMLFELTKHSYDLVYASLPKKLRM
ncbi:MAG: MmcQ/YjbR family DNA-binding protein [Flavobacteriia bacterium]|jgi:predicted DNA-binding protein (MmcQ/YjbR family)